MRRSLVFSFLLAIGVCVFAGGRREFTYVYARGDGSATTITHGSLVDVLRLQKRFSGPYLWAHVDGNEVLIRDAAVLGEIARAARPMEALTPEYEALHKRMRPLERRESRLDDELDALSDKDDDESDVDRERIRTLRSELRDIERELREYERQEERIDRRQEALERVFEEELEAIVKRAIRTGIAERVR
jgi:DNA repair exonuclease SbcCD ATPase subunit